MTQQTVYKNPPLQCVLSRLEPPWRQSCALPGTAMVTGLGVPWSTWELEGNVDMEEELDRLLLKSLLTASMKQAGQRAEHLSPQTDSWAPEANVLPPKGPHATVLSSPPPNPEKGLKGN